MFNMSTVRDNERQSAGLSPASLAPVGPQNHTLHHLPQKACSEEMSSFLPAQCAFLEVALKAREEGLWVQMTKGEDGQS